jgi:hypothetical protein
MGPSGVGGSQGDGGPKGRQASYGSIIWQVLDANTQTRIETGGRRYELQVEDYQVCFSFIEWNVNDQDQFHRSPEHFTPQHFCMPFFIILTNAVP